MNGALSDLDARRRAASDFDHNLVVRAGAGTGKTELLVERVLTAVASGRIEIGGLAALTFTEKAAAEMRERVAIGLDGLRSLALRRAAAGAHGAAARAYEYVVSSGKASDDEIAARSLAALTSLDRARITTIHAFCADLLRRFPREAGVDPQFRVDQGERFAAVFDLEWTKFLAEALGPRAPAPDVWRRLAGELGAAELRAIAQELAAFSFPRALLARAYEPPDARTLLAPEARELLARIPAIEAMGGLTPKNREFLQMIGRTMTEFLDSGLEAVRAQLAPPSAYAVRLEIGTSPGTKIARPDAAQLRSFVSSATRVARGLLAIDEDVVRRVFEALAPFALAFRESYLSRGLVDFDGLLQLARDLLADHPGVRRAVRSRIQMLVVDEFQDNDPVQYEIVLFLAEVDEGAASDAFDAKLAPGRLFVVGDAKQSIYRFRGADYDAFRRAAGRVLDEGGAGLHLTTNFRSVPEVLDAVHRLMGEGGVAWRETPHQPPYEAVVAHRAAAGAAVEVWSLAAARGGATLRAAQRREEEGRAVASQILEWVESSKVCCYREVTILLRSFSQLALYLKPLRAAGIPFIVDGGRDFSKRPEVEQLLAILRALASPSDPTALLAYLRSPAGGVPDTELARHAANRGAWDWRKPADEAQVPLLAAALARLRAIDTETVDLPIDLRIRRTIDRIDLLPLSAASFEGAQRVANLRKLAHLASELARDGTLSLCQVLDGLESERYSKHEADSPLADEMADAVRILTIHKAKGLENRRVILADVAREERDQPSATKVDLVLAGGKTLPAVAAGRCMNAARVRFVEERRRHEKAEENRVLYVALTRARDHLAVVVGPPKKVPAWVSALRAWGFDALNVPADNTPLDDGRVLHRCVTPSDAAALRSTTPAAFDDAVAAYLGAVDVMRRSTRTTRKPSNEELPAMSGDGGGAERSAARAVGTVVHGLLRRLDFVAGMDWRKQAAELAGPAAADVGADPRAVARESVALLESFLKSDLAARLKRAKVLGREVPVILDDEAGTWSGTLDLLLEEGGTIVIADYKTDREAPEDLVERYRPQLAVYARAVGKALSLPSLPRTELWILRSGRSVVVPHH